ncbi:hypothetical protein Misp01_70160 [Microtetraspora sp. NBRC 13810]|nr:hypothetical protein Misp01_70160 [Microtetraspora sp. NBRC 13810]
MELAGRRGRTGAGDHLILNPHEPGRGGVADVEEEFLGEFTAQGVSEGFAGTHVAPGQRVVNAARLVAADEGDGPAPGRSPRGRHCGL